VAATEVLIAMCDSGPGLELRSLDRLSDAFYTTKPHGLGLAISRRIIEAHGGRLWATASGRAATGDDDKHQEIAVVITDLAKKRRQVI
jgi:signal transduction histidine kinase